VCGKRFTNIRRSQLFGRMFAWVMYLAIMGLLFWAIIQLMQVQKSGALGEDSFLGTYLVVCDGGSCA
jgi:hypothetical protein